MFMGNPATNSDAVPPHLARTYIEDMLEELGRIAREAELADLDALLAMARVAAKKSAG